MQMQPYLAYMLVREAQERQIEAAARERRTRMPQPSLRRKVGRRIVALDTAAALKARCGTDSLEEVFMQLTGRSIEDEDLEGEGDGSSDT